MALNAETKNDDGSKHRTENADGSEHRSWETMMTLNAEIEKRWWIWMPKSRMMMALNVKTENDDGSECQNWESMMDLNVETEKWWCHQMPKMKIRIWTPNWRCSSERQSEDAALNTNRKIDMTTLNVELKMQGDNEGGICTSVTCYYSSQSMKMV